MDFGLYVSIDGGKTWQEMKNGLPTQPVHDLKIHPREHDLIVATHGRGIFITDISALEEISDKTLAQDFHLFDVESKVKWIVRRANVSATTNFNGESEPNGVMINYYQKAPAAGDVVVKVMQGSRVLAETKGPNAAGLNQVLWNMRATPVTAPGVAAPAAGGRGRRRRLRRRPRRRGARRPIRPSAAWWRRTGRGPGRRHGRRQVVLEEVQHPRGRLVRQDVLGIQGLGIRR